MKLSYLGVDLAKNVFQLHGVDRKGNAVWRRRLRRHQWVRVLLETVEPGCVIGMEACTGAHHWARRLQAEGYEVRLIAPQFVKPYVKSDKSDRNDAEAICEAVSRPHMRFVTIKSIEQQDLQALHRVRQSLMTHRIAKSNQIRGLVAEYGLVAPQHVKGLREAIPDWLEDAENGLSDFFRGLLNDLCADLRQLEARLAEVDKQLEDIARSNPDTQRLLQVSGIGPLTATALVASLGDARQFKRSRQMAAAIGLTPRQHSSGDKQRLFGISKRGDVYLRTLLIHGARAVILASKHKQDPLSLWVKGIMRRSHKNVAAVALANKMARIAWAMLSQGTDYNPELVAG